MEKIEIIDKEFDRLLREEGKKDNINPPGLRSKCGVCPGQTIDSTTGHYGCNCNEFLCRDDTY